MSARMRCWVGKPGDSRKFTVYTAKWCGACKSQVPKIQTLAQMYGFEVELVDVDAPEAKSRVPHIEYLGLEISFDEFLQVIKESVVGEGDQVAP